MTSRKNDDFLRDGIVPVWKSFAGAIKAAKSNYGNSF